MSIDKFKGKTQAWFIGNPAIISPLPVEPMLKANPGPFVEAPFISTYRAQYNRLGGNVYDGDKLIAVYQFGMRWIVDPAYRGRGIGSELVYQCIVRSGKRLVSTMRTVQTQRLLKAVWKRIQIELGETNYDDKP